MLRLMKVGEVMSSYNKINSIRNEIESHVGDTISIRDLGGRKKIFIKDGVIERAYSSIFTIKLDSDNNERRLTYSYSDILTNTVQIQYDL